MKPSGDASVSSVTSEVTSSDGGGDGGGGDSGGNGGTFAAGARSEESTHLRSSVFQSLSGMSQSVHSDAPGAARLYFPAGQTVQSSVLFPALYFPASHAVHWPALALAWQ